MLILYEGQIFVQSVNSGSQIGALCVCEFMCVILDTKVSFHSVDKHFRKEINKTMIFFLNHSICKKIKLIYKFDCDLWQDSFLESVWGTTVSRVILPPSSSLYSVVRTTFSSRRFTT